MGTWISNINLKNRNQHTFELSRDFVIDRLAYPRVLERSANKEGATLVKAFLFLEYIGGLRDQTHGVNCWFQVLFGLNKYLIGN